MAILGDTLVTQNWRNYHVCYVFPQVRRKTMRGISINIPNHPTGLALLQDSSASGMSDETGEWAVLLEKFGIGQVCTHRILYFHGRLKIPNLSQSHWGGIHPASFLLGVRGCNLLAKGQRKDGDSNDILSISLIIVFRARQRWRWVEQPQALMYAFNPCC